MDGALTKPQDAFTWRVVYADGSACNEYDAERPDGRGFAEIGKEPVVLLQLVHAILPPYEAAIPDGAQPVFFRRRAITINVSDETQQHSTLAQCIGWKRNEDEAAYLFVKADGSTLLTSDVQAV